MADQSPQSRHGITSFIFGLFLGSYLNRHRRRPRPIKHPQLENLSARQAMTVAAIANAIGFVVMVVLFGYAGHVLALLNP
jgi:hypothetical protein